MGRAGAPLPGDRIRAVSEPLPAHARVVIIGGGIIGCSVAYHLTQLGWRDVLLLERKSLTCGTTWHAAGLLAQLRATHNLTRLAQYSAELYARLEAETGQATGFVPTASLSIARDRERFEELLRGASMARCFASAALAASTIPVPFGTSIARPSMVTVTSSTASPSLTPGPRFP